MSDQQHRRAIRRPARSTPRPALWQLGLLLLLAQLLLACATPTPGDEASDESARAAEQTLGHSGYGNADLGVRIQLPEPWRIYTRAADAPPAFAGVFPPDKAPNESPLFFGHRQDSEAFVILEAEHAPVSILEYFSAIYRSHADRLDVLEARYSPERDSVRWRFRAKMETVPIVFSETMVIHGGIAYRMRFWTLESLLPGFESEFNRLANSLELHDGYFWTAPWAGLDATLSPDDLDFVELAAPPATQDEICGEGVRQSLWRVENGDVQVHLFGSIHLGKGEFYPLPQPIEAAFEGADALVIEADMLSDAGQLTVNRWIDEARYPEGESLADHIDPELFERLEATVHDMGLELEPFLVMRPWVAATMLSVLKIQSAGFALDAGVESYFYRRLGERELLELEGVEKQLSLFSSVDGEVFLSYTLLSIDTFDEELAEVIRSWRCGDDDALYELMIGQYESGHPEAAEALDVLILQRNHDMTTRIEELLRSGQGRYFVTVGTGHMVGEVGIPALLRERGWKVVEE